MKYHIVETGSNTLAFKKAFEHAVLIAKQNGTNSIVINVHVLSNLTGAFEGYFINGEIKELKTNKTCSYMGCTIYLETEQALKRFSRPTLFKSGVAFIAYVNLDLLEKALLDLRVTDSIYLPWREDELSKYHGAHPTSQQIT